MYVFVYCSAYYLNSAAMKRVALSYANVIFYTQIYRYIHMHTYTHNNYMYACTYATNYLCKGGSIPWEEAGPPNRRIRYSSVKRSVRMHSIEHARTGHIHARYTRVHIGLFAHVSINGARFGATEVS